MKAIKTIVIILLVIIGVVFVLGLLGEKTYRYERSVTINAKPEVIWDHVNSLAAMDKWSPWNEKDTAMKKSMTGEDGKPGAVAKWEGNNKVGKGEHRLDSLIPNRGVRSHLTMKSFFGDMESDVDIDLIPEGNGTQVKWAMHGENGVMGKVMGMFMDMDAMIGPDFEKGLGYLKKNVEEGEAKKLEEMKAMAAKYDIKTSDRASMNYVGVRKRVKWADMQQFFGESFGATMAAMGKAKVKPAGPPTGVYFEWDEVNKEADLIAGFPIAEADKGKVTEGVIEYATPAGKAYTVVYMGGYEKMEDTHWGIASKLELDGMEMNENVVEEYITDPMSEPDTAKWHTNIIWLAKPKAAN